MFILCSSLKKIIWNINESIILVVKALNKINYLCFELIMKNIDFSDFFVKK